jgi:hypothetical protein
MTTKNFPLPDLSLSLRATQRDEFYKRGMKTIGLGVDASNPSGTTRLYQRAGMVVASEFITYDKELRSAGDLEESKNRPAGRV